MHGARSVGIKVGENRDGLAVVDLYDATGTDRKLVVTAKMG
jgi:hypothetical protein